MSAGDSGRWDCYPNEENTGVVLDFSHVGDEGVETFQTAMLANDALTFAVAVLNQVLELTADED